VVRIRHDHKGIEPAGGIGDALVIGGNDDFIHLLALAAALPDVLDERFSGDEVERLAWEPGGAPARGNDDEDLRA
jgi:hypothetical protein